MKVTAIQQWMDNEYFFKVNLNLGFEISNSLPKTNYVCQVEKNRLVVTEIDVGAGIEYGSKGIYVGKRGDNDSNCFGIER